MNVLSMPMTMSAPKAGAGPLSLHNLIGGVARWFAHGSANAVAPMQRTSLRQMQVPRKENTPITFKAEVAPKLVASYAQNTRLNRPFNTNNVRILQVREPGQAQACVGRMVMSGRMADVCAELDRWVARDTALH
jgi:hypothetical protein